MSYPRGSNASEVMAFGKLGAPGGVFPWQVSFNKGDVSKVAFTAFAGPVYALGPGSGTGRGPRRRPRSRLPCGKTSIDRRNASQLTPPCKQS